jgi:hypothetical protein
MSYERGPRATDEFDVAMNERLVSLLHEACKRSNAKIASRATASGTSIAQRSNARKTRRAAKTESIRILNLLA